MNTYIRTHNHHTSSSSDCNNWISYSIIFYKFHNYIVAIPFPFTKASIINFPKCVNNSIGLINKISDLVTFKL